MADFQENTSFPKDDVKAREKEALRQVQVEKDSVNEKTC